MSLVHGTDSPSPARPGSTLPPCPRISPQSTVPSPSSPIVDVVERSARAAADPRKATRKGAPPSQSAAGDLEQQATQESEKLSDVLRAREIYAAMAAERRLSEEKIRAIWAEVQTEVMRIWQEVVLRRQKVMGDLLDKWSKALFG